MDLRSVRVKSFSRSFCFISQTSSSLSRRALFFTSSLSLGSIYSHPEKLFFHALSYINTDVWKIWTISHCRIILTVSALLCSHTETGKTSKPDPWPHRLNNSTVLYHPKYSYNFCRNSHTPSMSQPILSGSLADNSHISVSPILLRETAYTSSTQRLSPSSHCMTVWAEHITGRITHNNRSTALRLSPLKPSNRSIYDDVPNSDSLPVFDSPRVHAHDVIQCRQLRKQTDIRRCK